MSVVESVEIIPTGVFGTSSTRFSDDSMVKECPEGSVFEIAEGSVKGSIEVFMRGFVGESLGNFGEGSVIGFWDKSTVELIEEFVEGSGRRFVELLNFFLSGDIL